MKTFEFIIDKTNKTANATERKIMKALNSIATDNHDKPFKKLSIARKEETLSMFSFDLRNKQEIEKIGIDAETAKELGAYILRLATNKIM